LPPVPAHHYRETYRDADLDKLISDFGISEEHRDGLGPFLEDIAAIWRSKQSSNPTGDRPAKSSVALQRVAKLADQLNTALSDLPPLAEDALRRAYADADNSVLLGMSDAATIPKGAAFNIPKGDGSPQIVELEQSDIQDVIANISAMALTAADMPSGKVGVKRDHGLRLWMANVETYWTQTLGRGFTRDVSWTGDPISEPSRFCVAAFAFVSPETPPSRVLQEMKHCVNTSRRKIAGRIARQNDA
jgi:hypothetical protein